MQIFRKAAHLYFHQVRGNQQKLCERLLGQAALEGAAHMRINGLQIADLAAHAVTNLAAQNYITMPLHQHLHIRQHHIMQRTKQILEAAARACNTGNGHDRIRGKQYAVFVHKHRHQIGAMARRMRQDQRLAAQRQAELAGAKGDVRQHNLHLRHVRRVLLGTLQRFARARMQQLGTQRMRHNLRARKNPGAKHMIRMEMRVHHIAHHTAQFALNEVAHKARLVFVGQRVNHNRAVRS